MRSDLGTLGADVLGDFFLDEAIGRGASVKGRWYGAGAPVRSAAVETRRAGPSTTGPSPTPVPMARPSSTSTRSLLEVALGFLGALLIVPLVFKTATGLVKGVFRLGTTRRLLGDLAITGLTALLTRQDVLDTLFGKKGRTGDGLLKPPVD